MFVSATKIGENTTNILNYYVQTKFTLWHIKLNICQQEIKFPSHKQYLFGRLFSRNAKKTHTDQITLQVFILVSKETTHKPSRVATSKNVSSSVLVIDTTCACYRYRPMYTSSFFTLSQKETTHKISKVAASKNVSSSVLVIDATCFYECFLFHLIIGSHFFVKGYRNFDILPATILQLSLKQDFEKSPYFALAPQYQCNVNTKVSK